VIKAFVIAEYIGNIMLILKWFANYKAGLSFAFTDADGQARV
jgi:hypothetical protein